MANLPFGVATVPSVAEERVVVALGDKVVDLYAASSQHGLLDAGFDPAVFRAPSLNLFLAQGRPAWDATRAALQDLLASVDGLPAGVLVAADEVTMQLPVAVGDFVDGYGGIHHASNMGRILRPDAEALLPNWRRMPVAYHGRAATVVPSGQAIRRPKGQILIDGEPQLAPTARLDIELEVGFVIGTGNELGMPIQVDEAADHIFGMVLLNDWSARDIQAFEYQPLGPFLSKSFATSISHWIVPLQALQPHLVYGLAGQQDPPPAPYLHTTAPWTADLHLEVLLQTQSMRRAGEPAASISQVELADALYWSMAQQLAHATVNGASTRPGDLFGSGTVSGLDSKSQAGSLAEMSWGGTRSFELPNGESRTFLEDGDTVTLRGWCGGRAPADALIALGDVVGQIVPASPQ